MFPRSFETAHCSPNRIPEKYDFFFEARRLKKESSSVVHFIARQSIGFEVVLITFANDGFLWRRARRRRQNRGSPRVGINGMYKRAASRTANHHFNQTFKKRERERSTLAYRRFHSCLLPSSRVIVRFKRVAIDRERNLFYSFATRRRIKEMNTVKLCESRSRFTRMIKRRSHTLQILINLIKASP